MSYSFLSCYGANKVYLTTRKLQILYQITLFEVIKCLATFLCFLLYLQRQTNRSKINKLARLFNYKIKGLNYYELSSKTHKYECSQTFVIHIR